MDIVYLHASKFGNGTAVAAHVRDLLTARGATVHVHHIADISPQHPPEADLYVFSAPGRIGKPLGAMRRFLKRLALPAETPYAVLTTEMAPRPDRETGAVPSDEVAERTNRVLPLLITALDAKGFSRVAAGRVYVSGLTGPLEPAWREKAARFAEALPITA